MNTNVEVYSKLSQPLYFGKYKGKLFGEVARANIYWIKWAERTLNPRTGKYLIQLQGKKIKNFVFEQEVKQGLYSPSSSQHMDHDNEQEEWS